MAIRQVNNKKSKATSHKQDSTMADSSESSESAVLVNNMEFEVPDHVGSLGLENLEIKIKKEPEDWVNVEDKSTCWEDI